MQRPSPELEELIASAVSPMGYELIGSEYGRSAGGAFVLRVYIDHERGITLRDCEAVSRQLGGVLDVEDPIAGHYDLEVSSPGLDRPLFRLEHFERFAGARARIRLSRKLGDRRRFEGTLCGVEGESVLLDLGGERVELPLAMIESARLVPEL
jgi:ribosome maturation factor RimP